MLNLLLIKSLRRNSRFVSLKILSKSLKRKKVLFFSSVDPDIQSLERSVSDKIGLTVSIKNSKKNKGTITFSYHDIDQLNKIIDIIKVNY